MTFGDSITDGARSTPNTNNRWPDHLAKRLLAGPGNTKLAVLNTGIGGNRLLSDSIANFGINALARFDRDVLAQPGAMYVVVLEGINDIGNARANPLPSARDLIAAQQQIIERAHAHGLIIFGRHANAIRRRGLLLTRGRGQAPGGQQLDSNQQGLRWRNRF